MPEAEALQNQFLPLRDHAFEHVQEVLDKEAARHPGKTREMGAKDRMASWMLNFPADKPPHWFTHFFLPSQGLPWLGISLRLHAGQHQYT